MLIDRKQLESWSWETAESKYLFPMLMSRLIHASASAATHIHIPTGSAVFTDGYDGEVEAKCDFKNIPLGKSVWEFGTGADIPGKFSNDLKAREQDPLGYTLLETTFIFATPTFFKGKSKIQKTESKRGVWKEVKIMNSVDLAEWMNSIPSVARWFLKLTRNISVGGIKTSEEFHKEWFCKDQYKIPSSALTLGREKEKQQLSEFLSKPPYRISVRANSKAEAIAFVISCAEEMEEAKKEFFYAKTIIINSIKDFEVVGNNLTGLILIVNFEDRTALNSIDNQRNHIIVASGAEDPTEGVQLQTVSRDGLLQAAMAFGFNEFDARKYTKEAAGSMTILKRLLKFDSNRPGWANFENAGKIIPAMLMGSWIKDNECDRTLLEHISGKQYDVFLKELLGWRSNEVPPILSLDRLYRTSSPFELWLNLSTFLNELDIKNLEYLFESVFINSGSNFEFVGLTDGHYKSYSHFSQEGILQSLTLLALYGERLDISEIKGAQNFVDRLISNLFHTADENIWVKLSRQMEKIADASPNSLLDAAEQSLKRDKRILRLLDPASETKRPLSGGHGHANLLWALEGLAWIPEYFSRSVDVLAQWAALEYPYQITNTPLKSLSEILNPLFTQTDASREDRLEVMEILAERYPQVGWQLFSNFLKKELDGGLTHRLRWRMFSCRTEYMFESNEQLFFSEPLTDLLLSLYDGSASQFLQLIELSTDLAPLYREKVVLFLCDRVGDLPYGEKSPIRKVRSILSEHRSLPRYNWHLEQEELEVYQELYNILNERQDFSDKYWLFSENWPSFLDGINTNDRESHCSLLKEMRMTQLHNSYRLGGIQEIITAAQELTNASILGKTLGNCPISNQDEMELLTLFFNGNSMDQLVPHYVLARAIHEGIGSVKEIYEKYSHRYRADKKFPILFNQLVQTDDFLNFLFWTNPEFQRNYWSTVEVNFFGTSPELKIKALHALIEVGKISECLDVVVHAGYHGEKVPVEILKKILFAAAVSPENKRLGRQNIRYVFENLDLDPVGFDPEILELEMIYISHLGNFDPEKYIPQIFRKMISDPGYTVELLAETTFPDDPKDTAELAEKDILNRLVMGRKLFNSFRLIPGVEGNEVVDGEYLKGWTVEVRKLANEIGYTEAADAMIGRLLAFFPRNTDKSYPPSPICAILQQADSDRMLNAFRIQIFNSRGVTVRGPFSGGAQERVLVREFSSYAEKLKIRYPRVSRIFTELAKGYELHAKQEDNESIINSINN